MPLPIILDTDIGTDVDDALALAYLLRNPAYDVRLITVVSNDTETRARIAAELCRLAGRDDIEICAGIRQPLDARGKMNWTGHEGRSVLEDAPPIELSRRNAVQALVETLMAEEAEVLAVGPLSNLAAALIVEPRIAGRIRRLTLMGGYFRPLGDGPNRLPPQADYNLMADPAASLRVLNDPAIITAYVPLDQTLRVWLMDDVVQRLEAGDSLCQMLARMTRVWTAVMVENQRQAGRRLPPGLAAFMHDPLTAAGVLRPPYLEFERTSCTAVWWDGALRTFVDPVAGREVEVACRVDAAAFMDAWQRVVMGGSDM